MMFTNPQHVESKRVYRLRERDSHETRIRLCFEQNYREYLTDAISRIKYKPEHTFIEGNTIYTQLYGYKSANVKYTNHTTCFNLDRTLKHSSYKSYFLDFKGSSNFNLTPEVLKLNTMIMMIPYLNIWSELQRETRSFDFYPKNAPSGFQLLAELYEEYGIFTSLNWKMGRFYGAMRRDLPRVYSEGVLSISLPKGFRKQVARKIYEKYGSGPCSTGF